MRITIRRKNLEITPALGKYIEQKLLKPLRRSLKDVLQDELPILDLEVGRSTRHHHKGKIFRVAASLTIGKMNFRVEEESEDIRQACDILEEELEREILKFKGSSRAKNRRMARSAKKELHFDPAARFYRRGRITDEGN